MYYVFDCFKNENKNVVVLGEFDYRDVVKKHGLLKVMEDPSKSLKEREMALKQYDHLMGTHRGYSVSKGMYFPGSILINIPEDAEPLPDFEAENWENCFERRLESDQILRKLKELRSGVYHYLDGEEIDMVYQASEKSFLDWIDQHTGPNLLNGFNRPLSVQDRYKILIMAQEKGFVFGRIPEEWDVFEQERERVEKNRGMIRKV